MSLQIAIHHEGLKRLKCKNIDFFVETEYTYYIRGDCPQTGEGRFF